MVKFNVFREHFKVFLHHCRLLASFTASPYLFHHKFLNLIYREYFMRLLSLKIFGLILCLFLFAPIQVVYAGSPPLPDSGSSKTSEKKWDVNGKHGPTTDIDFETDEGTWISVDVSPDGQNIVFDLLGDIYIMPITGGSANLLAGGPAYEVQPRFSPDGKKISFTSDRDGCDNIWTMDIDGKNLQQITKEKERQTNNAVWSPDGNYLIARKHYRNTRSLGAGEMWMYHIGGGDGVQLTKRRNWEQDAGEPCLSPDGRYLYYSEDVSPGGGFQYNKDPNGVIYVIQRLDLQTGKTEQYINSQGGAVRPQVSPDGKSIAFVKRVRLKTVLFLYDIESGKETPLFDNLNRDAQETWAIFGVHPGFSWTPDSKSIVISAKGHIWEIYVTSKDARQIPFTAHVHQTITDAVRFPQEVAPEKFDVKMLRFVTVSPDQRSVVYTAIGKLYLKNLPDGKPHRVTNDESGFELYPSFSTDGKWIVYTTWNDRETGGVWKVHPDGSGRIKLTTRRGHYVQPRFSPDGTKIVFMRVAGDNLRGTLYSKETGIYWIPSAGGSPSLITEEGSKPTFSRAGDRIFLLSNEGEKNALISVGLHGEQRRVHFISDNAEEMIPSPDEKWLAIVERFNVYIAVFPTTGQAVTIGPNTTDYPIKRVTRDAGNYLNWSANSKKLYWSLGPELFSRGLARTFAFIDGAADSVQDKPDTSGLYIGFSYPTDNPTGSIALTGATVITMKGDEVLSGATILIERNRIKAIGKSSDVHVPDDAMKMDVSGKFIMPGIIDVHAHIGTGSDGITPNTHWGYYVNLAFGVTTSHDPSSNTEMVFSNSEMLKAGLMVGPRLYSTGTILYGAEAPFKAIINNYDDAVSHLRRMKAVGAFTIKSYNQPRRDQRQQIIEAARSLKMMVVPEGGSTFFWNMSMILDGHTGIEHSLPVSPLYKDAITLFSKSKSGYTPTLIVGYGGLWGENYWYMNTKVWENRRLLTFTPREIVDARSRRRLMAEEDDFNYIENAKSVKTALDAGTKVQLGAHGQLQGLGAHWELWMLAQGGMTPLEAIRCATLYGAEYIGLDHDLGSLETGKLADLIIMDKNPLENIRNSESIVYVMKNGRLYDAATMNEIGNHLRKRGKFYWEE
jgi:Tol biopolymer transport system component/imidazolonepropionase-like amidohydrolase